jgi:hypothetical protein
MARALIWVAVGAIVLIVIGMVVMSLLAAVLKYAVYLVVGALVVGAGFYLVGRARRALGGSRLRRLR